MAQGDWPVIPPERGDDLHHLEAAETADLVLFMAGNQFMAMADLVAAFRRAHPEIGAIFYETLPPGMELRQILAGGALFRDRALKVTPDIYSAVSESAMRQLAAAGRIAPGDYRLYLHNRLTLMVPAGNPAGINGVGDLGRPEVRVSQPDPANEDIAHHILERIHSPPSVIRSLLYGTVRNQMTDLRALYPWSGRKRKKETLRPLTVLKRLVLTGLAVTILPVVVLRWVPPPTTAFMLQKSAQARWNGSKDYTIRYRWTGWRHISPYAAQAVIAAEDQKFPVHWGFDPQSIAEAWEERQKGERIRGASTITQQVAKNLFLWPGKSFVRKGVEAYFTVLIETIWPKRRILEVYLNIAEFGRGVFGIAAASETFFRKTPDRLTRTQSALLAAALPNPRQLRIDRPSPYLRARAAWILNQMNHFSPPAF